MSRKEKAIVLLSGGLDSSVSLAAAVQEFDVILAITFNYGQRSFGKEIRASRLIADHYRVPHEVIALPWLSALLPKALMPVRGRETLPYEWHPGAAQKGDEFFEAKPVWVPNRNGVFLNIAAAFAEANDAQVVIFGANAEEAERFPDNTEAFRQKTTEAFSLSTLSGVRVECPLGHLFKSQIIEKAVALEVPLQMIWSCYADSDYQCGDCPSCYRLKAAIETLEVAERSKVKVAFLQ